MIWWIHTYSIGIVPIKISNAIIMQANIIREPHINRVKWIMIISNKSVRRNICINRRFNVNHLSIVKAGVWIERIVIST